MQRLRSQGMWRRCVEWQAKCTSSKRHHVTYALTICSYFTFIVLLFGLVVCIVHTLAMSYLFMYLYL
jgi:hypothetical protein